MNYENVFGSLGIPTIALDESDAGRESRAAELAERSQELIRHQRLESFKRLCPEEFRAKIDRARIPNLVAWDKADAWEPGTYPGLWLWSSATGKAKTRMLWRKVGQAMVKLGKRHLFTTGAKLGEFQYECWRDGEPTEFLRRFRNYDFVVLDDLDKFPLTEERSARALRELFDEFYSKHVSVLVSANEPPDVIGEKIGASCLRRVNAVCESIEF